MANEPIKTSTPNNRIKGRPPIRDDDSIQSPIQQVPKVRSPELIKKNKQNWENNHSGSLSDLFDSEAEADKRQGQNVDSTLKYTTNIEATAVVYDDNQQNSILLVIIVPVVLGFLLGGLYFVPIEEELPINFHNAANQFNHVDNDFWIILEVGINDAFTYNKPTTFLLVYQEDNEKVTEIMLTIISKTILTHLGKNRDKPKILNGSSLNLPEYIEDYGKVIHYLKNVVEENVLLIVKNIEHINGTVAQAFHSLCDDYNPIVKKALIFFTIKIEEYGNKNFREAVETKLKTHWSNLPEDDKFYPLYTRITSNVLYVK